MRHPASKCGAGVAQLTVSGPCVSARGLCPKSAGRTDRGRLLVRSNSGEQVKRCKRDVEKGRRYHYPKTVSEENAALAVLSFKEH